MAAAWNAFTVIEADLQAASKGGEPYSPEATTAIQGLGLDKIDAAASPESGRDIPKQVGFEDEVADKMRVIRSTFKGDPVTLEPSWLIADGEGVNAPVPVSAILQPLERAQLVPKPTEAVREKVPSDLGTYLRGAAATNHNGTSIPPAFPQILRRDAAWTIATAVASAAVYAATLYNSTWGTPLDYVGAFAAGFIGKAAISWVGMPFFQSLSTKAKAAATAATSASQT
jgi:hypothetical protein